MSEPSGAIWRSADQEALVTAIALEYPRWKGEGKLHYVERLAILSGLVSIEKAWLVRSDESIEHGRGALFANEPRLPYKDP